jgi:hypothetical protein
MRFEVLTTVIIQVTVFGDVTFPSLMHIPGFTVSSHRKLFFGLCVHLQDTVT